MLFIALLSLAFLGLFISKQFFDDFFTPPAIYNFFWAFALAMLDLDLVRYHPVGETAWRAIGLSYVAFMSGTLIVTAYALTKTKWLTAPPKIAHIDRQRFEWALFFLFGMGILGFLFQLYHLHASFGLSTFFTDPQRARELHSNVRFLGYFNLLNVANFVLSLMYLTIYRKPRRWIVFILFWATATAFFTTDRTRFFYMVIWAFYIFVYCQRRVNLSAKFVAGATTLIMALLGFFLLIAKLYVKQAHDYNRQFIKVPELGPLIDPYIYLTGSFPVLQQFLEDKWPPAYGKHTFAPMITFMELVIPNFEKAQLVGKFYWVPIHLNVCTYLEPFYKDFGWYGIALGPLFVGFFSMWVYVTMRQRKNMFTIYFAGLMSFCVTISVFINFYSQIATWFFVLIGYLIYRWCYSADPDETSHFRENIFQWRD
ncbi:Oligosaccharide repeat unit polymerase [Sulfidibacter corallicola]|uniref:Oligosaccharide repeat unit polymerase n=1 Tax=Sulfidibacter corallicola TaxID=2818388 RepID=A0A8A4TD10_SULCO|nr:O-antigen polymerase [Sulfidibacter corallicola]QTD47826.1 oligosaccharide repeat unit polymerase [Sulfidibacter corallicola]